MTAPAALAPCHRPRPGRRHGSSIRRPALRRRPDRVFRLPAAVPARPSRASSTRLGARCGKDVSQMRLPITARRRVSGRTTTSSGVKWATCCGRCNAGPRPRMHSKVRPPCSCRPESFVLRTNWRRWWEASIRRRRIGSGSSCGQPHSVNPGDPFAASGSHPAVNPRRGPTASRPPGPPARCAGALAGRIGLGMGLVARAPPRNPAGAGAGLAGTGSAAPHGAAGRRSAVQGVGTASPHGGIRARIRRARRGAGSPGRKDGGR